MGSSELFSLEDLYTKVNEIYEKHLDILRGLVITDISIDKALKPSKEGYYSFFNGTYNGSKKNYNVKIRIPNKIVKNYYDSLSADSRDKIGIKIDIKIEKIFITESGHITIIPSAIKETGVSDRELLRRRLHLYCESKGHYNRVKKDFPRVVTSILAITSKNSEIRDDILKNLNINPKKVEIVHCTTSEEIASTFESMKSNNYDVIVFFRGGREDESMSIFSHETIIEAIVNSNVPVCAALGHAEDQPFIHSIVDKVYHTPSVFATAITEHNNKTRNEKEELFKTLSLLFTSIKNRSQAKYERLQNSTEALSNQIYEKIKALIEITSSNIDSSVNTIHRGMLNRIDQQMQEIDANILIILGSVNSSIERISQKNQFSLRTIALLNLKRIESKTDSIDNLMEKISILSIDKTDKTLIKINNLYNSICQIAEHKESEKKKVAAEKRKILIIGALSLVILVFISLFFIFIK